MKELLGEASKLVMITDGQGDIARIQSLVERAVEGGVRTVQVREPNVSARALVNLCCDLRPVLDRVDGMLLVNDRADVAGTWAHGVHLGRRSVRPSQARELLGDEAIIGFSAHDVADVEFASQQGADYVSVSPVFATSSKPDAEPLGVMRTRSIVVRSSLPVIWLGGINEQTLPEVTPMEPFGVAVISAISSAEDPAAAAAALVEQLEADSQG